jgi:hypothetical protein
MCDCPCHAPSGIEPCRLCVHVQQCCRIAELEGETERMLRALREISRLRLATDEGSLRVRADRIWDLATDTIALVEDR